LLAESPGCLVGTTLAGRVQVLRVADAARGIRDRPTDGLTKKDRRTSNTGGHNRQDQGVLSRAADAPLSSWKKLTKLFIIYFLVKFAKLSGKPQCQKYCVRSFRIILLNVKKIYRLSSEMTTIICHFQ
jgi:hypothetical protein